MSFSRNVCLDTQVFKTNNFNFASKQLQLLQNRAIEQRISIYITDIVNRETRARIRREVEESRTWYNLMRKNARILLSAKNTPFHRLPQSLDVDAAVDSILKEFDAFLIAANITIINCNDVRAENILERYFQQKPPFNSGEKRKEFPDAISMEAIANHFARNTAYIISGDNDIRAACCERSDLHNVATLEDYLTLELADHLDVQWITDGLDNKSEEIQEVISKAFIDGYFYLSDQDGEVIEVSVERVSIEHINLVDVSGCDAEAAIDCDV